MREKRNGFVYVLLAAFVVTTFLALPIKATAEITEYEVRTMDQFLDAHNPIRIDLTRDPRLGDDRNYLNSHPDLREFLEHNDGIRNEMRGNANNFMRAVSDYQSRGHRWGGPGGEYQPRMRAALDHLQQAMVELEAASSDKGGYRKKAMDEIRRAQANVQAGINYDNRH